MGDLPRDPEETSGSRAVFLGGVGFMWTGEADGLAERKLEPVTAEPYGDGVVPGREEAPPILVEPVTDWPQRR